MQSNSRSDLADGKMIQSTKSYPAQYRNFHMQLSNFGNKYLGDCGILQLMDDLGKAVQHDDVIMLGGGNPSHLPAVQEIFRTRMGHILDSEHDFERLIGNYSSPEGDGVFIEALVDLLRDEYGWDIGPQNVALTNGSQTAFFFLFNLFAGTYGDGSHKKILLPLAPEYIGYEDAGLQEDVFTARRPQIEFLDNRLFKYHVDFDAIELTDEIGAICVSRPTNPTGNVLTEDEVTKLSALARDNDIPLILDNAYGIPFPGIIFTEAVPWWEPHIVLCMSLSKLGLPGARTGIVIAHEQIVNAITGMNAVISLAPGNLGAALTLDAVRSRQILEISTDLIQPHYRAKADQAVAWLQDAIDNEHFFIHKPEGAFFLWLWFRDMPITCHNLYERLKARGVVVVPGQYFFPGLDGEWRHKHECIRMSYAAEPELLQRGVAIIAEEVERAYQ